MLFFLYIRWVTKTAIILLTPGFPSDESDTSTLPAFQQFALSLSKQYPLCKLIIVSLDYPFIKKEYLWKGIPVYALAGKNRGSIHRILLYFRANALLKKISRRFSIKGIISLWLTDCAYLGEKFSKRKKIPHVIWIIGQDAKPGNKFVNRINPSPGQLVAMSDFLRAEFLKNYHIRASYVIENGISESIFPPLNTSTRPIDILGAGSLIPLKNYSLFIRLISELRNAFPNIQAQIAGEGEEFDKLKKMIIQSGLEKNLRLLGARPHSETLELMNQSRIFLHTSLYEGNSTVLMEALYSGCQVVSTQSLSEAPVENLFVSADRIALVQQLSTLLNQTPVPRQVLFNTMDRSAKKIMDLLGG
jgi:glycosyltransferase involved in cell wall biosynthesis